MTNRPEAPRPGVFTNPAARGGTTPTLSTAGPCWDISGTCFWNESQGIGALLKFWSFNLQFLAGLAWWFNHKFGGGVADGWFFRMKEGVILFSHFLGLGTNLMPQSQTCTDQKFWGRAFAHHLVLVIIHGAGTMYPKWQSLLTWHIFDGFKEWDLLLMAEILQVFDRYFLHNVPSVPHPFGARAGFFRRHQQRQTRKIESKNNYRQWYLAFFNGLNPTYLSLLRQSWRIGEGLGKLRWGTRGTRRQARGAGGWGLCSHGCGGGFASKPLVIENLRN